jgi:hypothetical protein
MVNPDEIMITDKTENMLIHETAQFMALTPHFSRVCNFYCIAKNTNKLVLADAKC